MIGNQFSHPCVNHLYRTDDGIRKRDDSEGSFLAIHNYPIEVAITAAALKRIGHEFNREGNYSSLQIDLDMQCGNQQPLCIINCDFFGYMQQYERAFETNLSRNDLCAAVDRVFREYMKFIEPCKDLFNKGAFDYQNYITQSKPSVEYNPRGLSRLVFPVGPFFVESEAPLSIRCVMGVHRCFMGDMQLNPNACPHGSTEAITSFSAKYLLGESGYMEEIPMTNKFLDAMTLPELLRIEMDYANGHWELVAVQRGIVADSRPKSAGASQDSDASELALPAAKEPPQEYMCPITQELMRDPVIGTDGNTYEREAIVTWLKSTTHRRYRVSL